MDTTLIDKNESKWSKHYYSLCNRAKERNLPYDMYVEKHHIYPRCLYGKNNIIVILTPEEHYVAHQLLVKMFPHNEKLLFAATRMTHGTGRIKRNNKRYGWLRRRFSQIMKERKLSKDHKRKIGKANKLKWESLTEEEKTHLNNKKRGPRLSKEAKEKIGNIHRGKKLSENHKKKLLETRKGVKLSETHKKRISNAHKGKEFSLEHKRKIGILKSKPVTINGTIYPSRKVAGDAFGITKEAICYWIKIGKAQNI